VLTVSVSIAAGVAAITSAAQGTSFEWISEHKVGIGVAFIVLIGIANLRGVRESGAFFAAPTYAFLISFLFMIGYGLIYYVLYDGTVPAPAGEEIKLAEGYVPQGPDDLSVARRFFKRLFGFDRRRGNIQWRAGVQEPQSRKCIPNACSDGSVARNDVSWHEHACLSVRRSSARG
jgi:hypothetical protein